MTGYSISPFDGPGVIVLDYRDEPAPVLRDPRWLRRPRVGMRRRRESRRHVRVASVRRRVASRAGPERPRGSDEDLADLRRALRGAA